MILKNRDNHIIGILKDGVLTKKVFSNVHKLRIVDGYGLDVTAYNLAVKHGAKELVIKEVDTGRTLKVDMGYFREKAIEINFGYGKQLALAGSYFEVVNGQEKLL